MRRGLVGGSCSPTHLSPAFSSARCCASQRLPRDEGWEKRLNVRDVALALGTAR